MVSFSDIEIASLRSQRRFNPYVTARRYDEAVSSLFSFNDIEIASAYRLRNDPARHVECFHGTVVSRENVSRRRHCEEERRSSLFGLRDYHSLIGFTIPPKPSPIPQKKP